MIINLDNRPLNTPHPIRYTPPMSQNPPLLPPDHARSLFTGKTLQYVEQSIAHWLMSSGSMVVMVPCPTGSTQRGDVTYAHYAAWLDGLVLHGGADVWPGSYGEEPLRPEWLGDRVRDLYDLAVVEAFSQAGKPIFGVCRGLQLINVAFGGTLYQDIATQCPAAHAHVDTHLYDQLEHDVTFIQGSALTALYPNAAQLRVTSIHHQAVAELGKGVVVEAVSTLDGLVEAIRWTGDAYARGVQWHPEFHHGRDALADSSPIMMDFLEASRDAAMQRLEAGLEPDPRMPRQTLRLSA